MFRSCKALLAAAAAALRVDLILMLRQGPSRKVIDAVRNFKSESEPACSRDGNVFRALVD